MSEPTLLVRLLFADEGGFHHEEVRIPAEALDRYERLVDLIREEEAVLRRLYVDVDRLCAATVVEPDDEAARGEAVEG